MVGHTMIHDVYIDYDAHPDLGGCQKIYDLISHQVVDIKNTKILSTRLENELVVLTIETEEINLL